MLSSGKFSRVVSVWSDSREIYLEKHRDDKIVSDVYGKRASPPTIGLGASCDDTLVLQDPKADPATIFGSSAKGSAHNHHNSSNNNSSSSNTSNNRDTKHNLMTSGGMTIIKFHEPRAVAPMAALMGPAVAGTPLASAAPQVTVTSVGGGSGGAAGGGGGGAGGSVEYKNAEKPTQTPPTTPSRIGLRRSTANQPVGGGANVGPSEGDSASAGAKPKPGPPTRVGFGSLRGTAPPPSAGRATVQAPPAGGGFVRPLPPSRGGGSGVGGVDVRSVSSPPGVASSPFKKEKVMRPICPMKSLLEIADLPQSRRMEVVVHIFDAPQPKGPPILTLKVPVSEAANVKEVIVDTRKAYQKEKGEELGAEPTDFVLYVAEDDGRPDEDLPSLRHDQSIRKLGKNFCLVPSKTRKRTPTRERPSYVKIQLPGNEYKTVPFQPEQKIKDLLFQVCHKWNLDATEHAFRVGKGLADIAPDVTMQDLDTHTNGKNNLVLVKKDIKAEEEHNPDVWDRIGAITMKQYDVTKIKGFINRQERVLGISGEMITNDAKRGKTTKRPMRLIADVRSIEQSKRKECQFVIKFSDNKSYTYEAKSPELAREIVQKVTTCMMLKNSMTAS